MMALERIVCLANSYKHEHRCVAGISLASKRWVRLVGKYVPGCLTVKETSYADGRQAALLDVFEAELEKPCGTNAHPEDRSIGKGPWRLIRRFDDPDDGKLLSSLMNKGPALLQGYGDRVYTRKLESAPAERSLELIHPDDLWWWIREDGGKRKNRAVFRLGRGSRARYDLAVTDPAWLDQLNLLPAGIYPHSFLHKGDFGRTLLTVSLSEPFEGFHYKLAAGVIDLPA